MSNSKVCCVCEKNCSSYKCPTCRLFYCSSACYKEHKSLDCNTTVPCDVTKSPNLAQRNYDFPTEDTVSLEKLQGLRQSEEVKKCLQNPHVRDIMKAILNDKDPTKAIALAMTEPIFVELADACLKVVEPSNES